MTPRLLAKVRSWSTPAHGDRRQAAAQIAQPGRLSAVRRRGCPAGRGPVGQRKARSPGKTAEEWLAGQGVPPDFAATTPLRYIHRATADADIYFVANPEPYDVGPRPPSASRAGGPSSGGPTAARSSRPRRSKPRGSCTSVPLRLGPSGSVFVVFRKPAPAPIRGGFGPRRPAAVAAAAAQGEDRHPQGPLRRARRSAADPRRAAETAGDRRWRRIRATWPAWPRAMIRPHDRQDAGGGLHGRRPALARDGHDPEAVRFAVDVPAAAEVARVRFDSAGRIVLEASQAGRYELKTASGRGCCCEVPALPPAMDTDRTVGRDVPAQAVVQQKTSLAAAADPFRQADLVERPCRRRVKYYSGTAAYRTTFDVPAEMVGANRRIALDLGKVAVMAEVRLNGRDLGILWKPPVPRPTRPTPSARAERPGSSGGQFVVPRTFDDVLLCRGIAERTLACGASRSNARLTMIPSGVSRTVCARRNTRPASPRVDNSPSCRRRSGVRDRRRSRHGGQQG